MNTDLFLLVGRKKLKLLYCQNKVDIREYEHDNDAHIPFYFYSNNNGDILLGKSAKNKYENFDQNAYYDYFNLIKNVNQKFTFYGEDQKIEKIIVRATEYLVNDFLKNVLFSAETVYELKDKINISLIFYNDVSENEITFVNSIFKKEGYKRIKSFYYNYLLLNYLDKNRKIGSFKGYIIADSIDNNLHINYFDSLNRKQYKNNAIGKDLAVDPKIKLLGSTILNVAIEKTGSLVNPDDEAKKHEAIFKEAYKLYNKKSEFKIDITLSDGAKANVKIKKSRIRDKLAFAGEFTKDFSFLDHFYENTGIQQSEVIFILHKDIHSDNFSDKIKSNYTNVYHSKELSTEIFQLFYKNSECANNGDLTLTKSKPEKKIEKDKKIPQDKAVKKVTRRPPPPPPPPPPAAKPKVTSTKPRPTKPTNTAKKIPLPPPPPAQRPKVTSTKPRPVKSTNTAKKRSLPPPPPIRVSRPKKNVANEKSTSPPPLPKNIKKAKTIGPPPLPRKK